MRVNSWQVLSESPLLRTSEPEAVRQALADDILAAAFGGLGIPLEVPYWCDGIVDQLASRVACTGATSVAVAVLIATFRSIALIRASHVHSEVAPQAPFGSGLLAFEIEVSVFGQQPCLLRIFVLGCSAYNWRVQGLWGQAQAQACVEGVI